MQKTFAMSCTEVYEIINSLPKAEFEKIPLHEIEFLKKNKDNEYKFIVDKNINIEELNISKRANAMIVILWEKYFASDTQKQKLKVILDNNQKIVNKKREEQYSYQELFNKNRKQNNHPTLEPSVQGRHPQGTHDRGRVERCAVGFDEERRSALDGRVLSPDCRGQGRLGRDWQGHLLPLSCVGT